MTIGYLNAFHLLDLSVALFRLFLFLVHVCFRKRQRFEMLAFSDQRNARQPSFHSPTTRGQWGVFNDYSQRSAAHQGHFGEAQYKSKFPSENKKQRKERQKQMKAAVKEQQSMFVSPVSKASSSKDEQYITPTKIGPDEAETVSAMNSLIRKKSVLNGIIWQYINETTGVIELSIHEKSLFGKSKQLPFWIGPSRADCGLYGTFLDILVETHFFNFPESRLQGTFLRLQKPRLIPTLPYPNLT